MKKYLIHFLRMDSVDLVEAASRADAALKHVRETYSVKYSRPLDGEPVNTLEYNGEPIRDRKYLDDTGIFTVWISGAGDDLRTDKETPCSASISWSNGAWRAWEEHQHEAPCAPEGDVTKTWIVGMEDSGDIRLVDAPTQRRAAEIFVANLGSKNIHQKGVPDGITFGFSDHPNSYTVEDVMVATYVPGDSTRGDAHRFAVDHSPTHSLAVSEEVATIVDSRDFADDCDRWVKKHRDELP